MIKRWLSLIIVFFCCYAWADVIPRPGNGPVNSRHASTTTASVAVSTPGSHLPITLVDHPNTAFRVGEQLKFVIKYEFVGAGEASMVVKQGLIINGRPTIHMETKANSNKVIDKIFKVRDVNSSTIDEKAFVSVAFHQNLKEGGYHVMRTTTMDYQKGTYTFERTRKGKTTNETGTINQPLQDILSAFFYMRTLPLEPGKEFETTVFSDKDIYALKVKVNPKIQKISVPAGKFDCLRIEPVFMGDAIFKTKDGKMIIWLTNDERKMPVLLRSKVFVGAFDAELTEYQSGK